jgi:hypothetical protein
MTTNSIIDTELHFKFTRKDRAAVVDNAGIVTLEDTRTDLINHDEEVFA